MFVAVELPVFLLRNLVDALNSASVLVHPDYTLSKRNIVYVCVPPVVAMCPNFPNAGLYGCEYVKYQCCTSIFVEM